MGGLLSFFLFVCFFFLSFLVLVVWLWWEPHVTLLFGTLQSFLFPPALSAARPLRSLLPVPRLTAEEDPGEERDVEAAGSHSSRRARMGSLAERSYTKKHCTKPGQQNSLLLLIVYFSFSIEL